MSVQAGSLSAAIILAATAHDGQTDKAGQAYILHPLRLMLSLETDEERIVALLHDVVEDTATTFGDLEAAGFSSEIIGALDCLTHRHGEEYFDYIGRIAKNPLAVRVKLADLEDNMNLARIAEPTEKDLARIEKYRRAVAVLNP